LDFRSKSDFAFKQCGNSCDKVQHLKLGFSLNLFLILSGRLCSAPQSRSEEKMNQPVYFGMTASSLSVCQNNSEVDKWDHALQMNHCLLQRYLSPTCAPRGNGAEAICLPRNRLSLPDEGEVLVQATVKSYFVLCFMKQAADFLVIPEVELATKEQSFSAITQVEFFLCFMNFYHRYHN